MEVKSQNNLVTIELTTASISNWSQTILMEILSENMKKVKLNKYDNLQEVNFLFCYNLYLSNKNERKIVQCPYTVYWYNYSGKTN